MRPAAAPYPGREEPPILIVDDNRATLEAFAIFLRGEKIRNYRTIEDPREVLPLLAAHGAALILLDLVMPHLSGMELLREIRRTMPVDIPVIIVTGINEVETAVGCLKEGAFDYLVKPVEKSRLLSCVRRALEIANLRREIHILKTAFRGGGPKDREAFADFITRSPKLEAVFQYVEAVAASPQTLLITGETGVGKELIARTAHALSGRAGPFVAINVAGLDDNMFSDTLFGHERGAFTSAEKARGGLITRAAGGTLFLDEIGELSGPSQVKLLRLIQEQSYYPLGSDILRPSEARIIAATNRDLPDLLREKGFRKDLYYRLATHHVHIPPLRERREDLWPLVEHFLKEAAAALKQPQPALPEELLALLATYGFPGNVRELQAMIYDAVARPHAATLSLRSFKEVLQREAPDLRATCLPAAGAGVEMQYAAARFPTLREMEGFLVAEALRRANNRKSLAASLLGISRQALSKRLLKGKPGAGAAVRGQAEGG